MSDGHKTNGGTASESAALAVPTVTITVEDMASFRVHIGGAFPSFDYALNMLDTARRELEARWRLERMAQAQAQAFERAQTESIRQQLQKGR